MKSIYYNRPILSDLFITFISFVIIFFISSSYSEEWNLFLSENGESISVIAPALASLLGFTIAGVSILGFLFDDKYFNLFKGSPHFKNLFEVYFRVVAGFLILMPILILPLFSEISIFKGIFSLLLLFFFVELGRAVLYLKIITLRRVEKIMKEFEPGDLNLN